MILEYLLGLAGFVQVLVQGALFFFRPKVGHGTCPGLSVVVCGRNAEFDWKRNLDLWLACKTTQPVEFVLIDDASTDASLAFLNSLACQEGRVRVLSIDSKSSPGKRDALALGLSQAKFQQVFVTDADCRPDSPTFLQELMDILGAEPALFVGNGLLISSNSLASNVAMAEADRLARMNFSGLPWIGFTTAVGRNMAYPKETGLAALRYSKKFGTAGGDDDLGLPFLVSRCQNKRFGYKPSTLSDAPATFQDWALQKQRHWKTAPHYPFPIKAVFVLRWLLLGANTLGLIVLPFFHSKIAMGLVLAGWSIQLFSTFLWVYVFASIRKPTPKALWVYLMAELLAIFVPVLILLQKPTNTSKTWNSNS
ncbi:MAG: glycosyltransferase [Bacteroidetes bacterium]|nr:glycosyltransferase [Bacteroidota bacterium]